MSHFAHPWDKGCVDDTGKRLAFVCALNDELSDCFRPKSPQLGHEVSAFMTNWFNVVAIGEACNGQAFWSGDGFGHAIEGTEGCHEGDLNAHPHKALGELEGWVDKALAWKCYKEDVNVVHFGGNLRKATCVRL